MVSGVFLDDFGILGLLWEPFGVHFHSFFHGNSASQLLFHGNSASRLLFVCLSALGLVHADHIANKI